MGDMISTITYIAFLLVRISLFVVVAFGIMYTIFGVIPFAIVNGLMAITGKRWRIPWWALPYMGWGASIASLTLLSIVANFQTNLKYGGTVGDWVTVKLVEAALTGVGVGLVAIAFAKQRSRVHAQDAASAVSSETPNARRQSGAYAVSQVDRKNAARAPIRVYIYWLFWFLGIFILNVLIDTIYIAGLGVDIQGVGPGWIIFIDG